MAWWGHSLLPEDEAATWKLWVTSGKHTAVRLLSCNTKSLHSPWIPASGASILTANEDALYKARIR